MSAITALLKKDLVGKFLSNTVLAYPTTVLILEMMRCTISTIQFTDITYSLLEHEYKGKINEGVKLGDPYRPFKERLWGNYAFLSISKIGKAFK